MKDIRVPRVVTAGWTSESLRLRNTTDFAEANGKAVIKAIASLVAYVAVPSLWLLPVMQHVSGVIGVPLFIATLVCAYKAIQTLSELPERFRLRAQVPYRPEARSNDPENAADALDTMLEELRLAPLGSPKLTRAYETAMLRLQAIRRDTPLHTLVRRGYYPSRPYVNLANGQSVPLDYDASSDQVQWDRMSTAADSLRKLLRSPCLVPEHKVHEALSDLVPPMRAVLRRHQVATHRIEYLPGTIRNTTGAAPAITDETKAPSPSLPAPAAASLPDDGLTAVEDRLNASATMAVSAIRTLELSFRAAEDELFVGDDLDTGRRLMSQHVPSLVKAYVVAHDAAQGEDRDQIRAEFAQGLGVVRDTLAGIMRRHAQEARRRMEEETNFLRMRHGEGPLSPAGEPSVF